MYGRANQLIREPAVGRGESVANLITGERLKHSLDAGGFIRGGSPKSLEGAKYDFRMSPVILKASFGQPVNIDKLPEDQRGQARVDPGEVVFVRTSENLTLPNNMIATLSPKRKLSHQGIIVLGGLCVDPNYNGPLFIGLYNFSSTPFPLLTGKKLIAAMFYELAGEELATFPVPEVISEGSEDFPDDLLTLIRNYKPVELKGLTETLSHLKGQFDALQDEVRDDRTWKKDFREALDQQTKQIDKLIDGLTDEKEVRKEEDKALRTKLEGMSTLFTNAKLIWAIAWTVLALLLGHFAPKVIAGEPLFGSKSPPAMVAPPPALPRP